MHENIKRFYLDGEVSYAYLSKARKTLEESLEDKMRLSGYVRVLDIDPQLTQEFDSDSEKFKVTISLYGAYVGEEECKNIAGMMYGKPIMKYTPKDKSNQSLKS